MPILNASGWLPYGSDDDSVIFQHPFTSDPTTYMQSKGTTTKFGTPTFDADLGMKANSVSSGGFSLVGLTNLTKADSGFQISFEVETEWLAINDPTVASVGYTTPTATAECVISSQATSGLNFTGWAKDIGGTSSSIGFSVSSGAFKINSNGKSRFTRVNLGFRGGRAGGTFTGGFNGGVHFEKVANASTMVGFFNTLYFGSNRNIANTYCQRYMRNFQISTRPPMFSIHPKLRSIGLVSDSIMNNVDVSTSVFGDASTTWTIRQKLAERGLFTGVWNTNVVGGVCYSSAGGTYLYNQLASVLATNPSILIISGGANDAAQFLTDDADWETQVMLYITEAFANPWLKMIVMTNILYLVGDSTKAATVPFVKLGNERLLNVAATWRAANPTDPRKLIVADISSALGGLSPPRNTMIGQVNGLFNDLHPSSLGHFLHGQAVSRAILAELGDL